MKFFVTSFLVIFCLAPHSSGPDTVRTRGITMIRLASTDRDNEPLKADFIGGGIIQDSCRGEVKFSSKLNHIRDSLDWIRYEVTPANSKAKIFEGWWHWKATPSFMSDYRGFHRINLDDPHEDMDLGEYGDEDGWQEECEHRSTDVSQCDRMFGHNMYYPERLKLKPNMVRLPVIR